MRTAQWKAVERALAGILGGERVPVTGRGRGATPDIAHATLSIEVKHRAALPAWLHDAMAQAKSAERDGRLPVVILHEKRQPYADSFALMRVRDLQTLLEG